MKNLFNLLLTGGVFWVGNKYFSEYISIVDMKTLMIATLLMVGIGYLFGLFMLTSVLTIPLVVGCFTTVILFLMAFILTPIKLWLLDTYLIGFNINGFWTYVVITAILSIFSIKSKKENKTEVK